MGGTRGLRPLAGVLVLALLAAPSASGAQDAGTCPGPPNPEPLETTPSNGATGVTLNAPVRVRYTEGFFVEGPGAGRDPLDLIEVWACPEGLLLIGDIDCQAEGGSPLGGSAQIIGDELVFVPRQELDPTRVYSGVASGLGFADLPFAFETGTSLDLTPPIFPDDFIRDLTSTRTPMRCDAPQGGFRISVFFEAATDDGPAGSIEYLLFQTRGQGIEEPVLRDRVRQFVTSGRIPMAFVLPPSQANQPICVQVVAVDGLTRVARIPETMNERDCTNPVQGNFFEPLCAVGAPGTGGGEPLGAAVALAAGALLVLRRRRRRAA